MKGTVRTGPRRRIGPRAALRLRPWAEGEVRSWTDAVRGSPSYAPTVREYEPELPRWTPYVTAGTAVVIGAGTFAQRAQTPSAALDLVLVLLATAPWVVAIVRPLPIAV